METPVKFKPKTKIALMIYGLFIGTIASPKIIYSAMVKHQTDPVIDLVMRYARIARPFVVAFKILFYIALFLLILYALDIVLGIGMVDTLTQSFKESPAYR